jgi:tRNA U38,U39,U40 pseudouridine synthase TruA
LLKNWQVFTSAERACIKPCIFPKLFTEKVTQSFRANAIKQFRVYRYFLNSSKTQPLKNNWEYRAKKILTIQHEIIVLKEGSGQVCAIIFLSADFEATILKQWKQKGDPGAFPICHRTLLLNLTSPVVCVFVGQIHIHIA